MQTLSLWRGTAAPTARVDGTDMILRTLPEYSRREIAFLLQHEKVIHLDDFLLRRSMLGMLGRVTREMVEELAGVFSNHFGWMPEQREAEVARTLSIFADRHGIPL